MGQKGFLKSQKEKHGSMYVNEDLIDLIWTDRPPMSKAPVMIFDNKYIGEDISSKLKRVREQMAQKGCNTSSDVITLRYRLAFKCRGGDISYVPVVLSYRHCHRTAAYGFCRKRL